MNAAVQEAEARPVAETQSGVFGMADRFLHGMLGIALIFVVAVNVLNASGRYFLGVSPTGADELMIYTIIWVVMVGAVLSLARREHISVNLLPSTANGRFRHVLFSIHDLAALLGCGYATYASYHFVTRIGRLGTKSMGLGLPMTLPHAALLFGFACLTLVATVLFVRGIGALLRNDPHPEAAG